MHLLLSLGHNSSAVLVDDTGKVVLGYENERLTKIKSDSQFPSAAIEEIEKYAPLPPDVAIYVSHWFIDGELPDKPNKWWNLQYFDKYPDCKIFCVNKNFSHHDAHAWSAMAFIGEECESDSHVIVADGFGNFGETFSIYKVHQENTVAMNLEIVHRSFGFESSIGLFYQYATSYLDMKENQDEYKLLGYEAYIYNDILSQQGIQMLSKLAENKANDLFKRIISVDIDNKYDPLCSIDALPALKEKHRNHFDKVLKDCWASVGVSEHNTRIIIAHYVQKVVENTLVNILDHFKVKNPILTGGIFMNVKLNKTISDHVDGRTCIMPLAGDQGAPIGIYHYLRGNFKWPGHLFWGKRDYLCNHHSANDPHLMYYHDSGVAMYEKIAALISQGCIVNVVKGSMEFGSRALGNTSTLALPNIYNVEYINMCNNRSTIMPMAGVVKKYRCSDYHIGCDRIIKSLDYMICTREFRHNLADEFKGVRHFDPTRNIYTGRSQTVDRSNHMWHILSRINSPMIINTSFNPHGKPILYSMDDVVDGHKYMRERDIEDKVFTIVIY